MSQVAAMLLNSMHALDLKIAVYIFMSIIQRNVLVLHMLLQGEHAFVQSVAIPIYTFMPISFAQLQTCCDSLTSWCITSQS